MSLIVIFINDLFIFNKFQSLHFMLRFTFFLYINIMLLLKINNFIIICLMTRSVIFKFKNEKNVRNRDSEFIFF